eukprot:168475_1
MSFDVTKAIKIVDELLTHLSPPVLEEEKKYEQFRSPWKKLSADQLVENILRKYLQGSITKELFEIFDVRDDDKDFPGGNIITAKNIPVRSFRKNLGKIFNEFYDREVIVIHCMYSQQRGVQSANWYTRSLEELVNNYCNPKLKNKQPNYSSQYSSLKDIKLNDNIIECLKEQRVFLLVGGFNNFLNRYYDDNHELFENFDNSLWRTDHETKLVHIFDM